MSDDETVPNRPKEKGPNIWLIKSDSTAKRMRLTDNTLRTVIDFETMISRKVDEIKIDDVVKLSVLAPYTINNPRVSLVIFGISLGMIIGSQFTALEAIVLAYMVVTFSVVALVIGRNKNQSQKIARLEMKDGTGATIVYLIEDESEVRSLFSPDIWDDKSGIAPKEPLKKDEENLLEKMHYGMLLMAGSVGIIALMMAIGDGTGISELITIPVNILYLAVLVLTMMFSGISWYKMIRAGRRKN